jgi:hypothetical protein
MPSSDEDLIYETRATKWIAPRDDITQSQHSSLNIVIAVGAFNCYVARSLSQRPVARA